MRPPRRGRANSQDCSARRRRRPPLRPHRSPHRPAISRFRHRGHPVTRRRFHRQRPRATRKWPISNGSSVLRAAARFPARNLRRSRLRRRARFRRGRKRLRQRRFRHSRLSPPRLLSRRFRRRSHFHPSRSTGSLPPRHNRRSRRRLSPIRHRTPTNRRSRRHPANRASLRSSSVPVSAPNRSMSSGSSKMPPRIRRRRRSGHFSRRANLPGCSVRDRWAGAPRRRLLLRRAVRPTGPICPARTRCSIRKGNRRRGRECVG